MAKRSALVRRVLAKAGTLAQEFEALTGEKTRSVAAVAARNRLSRSQVAEIEKARAGANADLLRRLKGCADRLRDAAHGLVITGPHLRCAGGFAANGFELRAETMAGVLQNVWGHWTRRFDDFRPRGKADCPDWQITPEHVRTFASRVEALTGGRWRGEELNDRRVPIFRIVPSDWERLGIVATTYFAARREPCDGEMTEREFADKWTRLAAERYLAEEWDRPIYDRTMNDEDGNRES